MSQENNLSIVFLQIGNDIKSLIDSVNHISSYVTNSKIEFDASIKKINDEITIIKTRLDSLI
ncbi:hypothetical protein CCP3SC5AM1_720017 [Gammaproteobacteria bacterium]